MSMGKPTISPALKKSGQDRSFWCRSAKYFATARIRMSLTYSEGWKCPPPGIFIQRRALLRNLHHKTPALKRLVAISIRRVPQRPDFHLAVTLRHLTRRPPLLFYVSLDHLCRGARRQISVFAFLQQSANHNLRISPRLNSSEPSVIFKLALTHCS